MLEVPEDALFADAFNGGGWVDLDWMFDDSIWFFRLNNILSLKKNIAQNKFMRNVIRDLTKFLDDQKSSKPSYEPRYYVNWMLVREIRKIVKNNANLNINIYGPTGSGKSLVGIKIGDQVKREYQQYAAKLDEGYKKNCFEEAELYIEFPIDDANRRMSMMKPGDVLIKDEQTKSEGMNSNIEGQRRQNVRKSIRSENINFIDIGPSPAWDDEINIQIYVLGFNKIQEFNICLMYVLDPNPPPGTTSKQILAGYLILKKFSDDDFIDEYERRKTEYNQTLQQSGGTETVSRATEIQDAAEKLVEFILADSVPWPTKKSQWLLAYERAGLPTKGNDFPTRVVDRAQQIRSTISRAQGVSYDSSRISDYIIEDSEFDLFLYKFAARQMVEMGLYQEESTAFYWVGRNLVKYEKDGRGKFKELTHPRIAEMISDIYQIEVTRGAVSRGLSDDRVKEPSSNQKGDILEKAIYYWMLNRIEEDEEFKAFRKRIAETPHNGEISGSAHDPSPVAVAPPRGTSRLKTGEVLDVLSLYWRLGRVRGGSEKDCDLCLIDRSEDSTADCLAGWEEQSSTHLIAINAKLASGPAVRTRDQYQRECSPEFFHCPEDSYIMMWNPRSGFHVVEVYNKDCTVPPLSEKERGWCADVGLAAVEEKILAIIHERIEVYWGEQDE